MSVYHRSQSQFQTENSAGAAEIYVHNPRHRSRSRNLFRRSSDPSRQPISDDEPSAADKPTQNSRRSQFTNSITPDDMALMQDFCKIAKRIHEGSLLNNILEMSRDYEDMKDKVANFRGISNGHRRQAKKYVKGNAELVSQCEKYEDTISKQRTEKSLVENKLDQQVDLASKVKAQEEEISRLRARLEDTQIHLEKEMSNHDNKTVEMLTDREEQKVQKMVAREKIRELVIAAGPTLAKMFSQHGADVLIPMSPEAQARLSATHDSLWESACSLVWEFISVPSQPYGVPQDNHHLPISTINSPPIRLMYIAYSLITLTQSLITAWNDNPWFSHVVSRTTTTTTTPLKDPSGHTHKDSFLAAATATATFRLSPLILLTHRHPFDKSLTRLLAKAYEHLSAISCSTDNLSIFYPNPDSEIPIPLCCAFDSVRSPVAPGWTTRMPLAVDGTYVSYLFPCIINKSTGVVIHPGYALFSGQAAYVKAISSISPSTPENTHPSLHHSDNSTRRLDRTHPRSDNDEEHSSLSDKSSSSSTTATVSSSSPRKPGARGTSRPRFLSEDLKRSGSGVKSQSHSRAPSVAAGATRRHERQERSVSRTPGVGSRRASRVRGEDGMAGRYQGDMNGWGSGAGGRPAGMGIGYGYVGPGMAAPNIPTITPPSIGMPNMQPPNMMGGGYVGGGWPGMM